MSNRNQLMHRPAWKALKDHYERVHQLHLRDLFADDASTGGAIFYGGLGDFFGLFKKPGHG